MYLHTYRHFYDTISMVSLTCAKKLTSSHLDLPYVVHNIAAICALEMLLNPNKYTASPKTEKGKFSL